MAKKISGMELLKLVIGPAYEKLKGVSVGYNAATSQVYLKKLGHAAPFFNLKIYPVTALALLDGELELGESEKGEISGHILKSFASAGMPGSSPVTLDIASYSGGPAKAKAPIITNIPVKPSPVQTTTVAQAGILPELKDATDLYELVKGTDTGSKYLVVGIIAFKDGVAKIAARWKGSALSVRIVGAMPLQAKTDVLKSGFTQKTGYLSAHFGDITDHSLIQKVISGTIGMIASYGGDLVTKVPSATALKGKGV